MGNAPAADAGEAATNEPETIPDVGMGALIIAYWGKVAAIFSDGSQLKSSSWLPGWWN
jgi:hypothetical protein